MDQRSRSRTVAALATAAALALTAHAPGAQATAIPDVVGQVEERAAPAAAALAEVRIGTEHSPAVVVGAPEDPVHDAPRSDDIRQ